MSYARVTLLPSGQALIVEDGETLLDAALRAGLNLPHSCKGGHCSACRAHLRSGRVRYPCGRPLGLLEEEERAGWVLLCQAHAATGELAVDVQEIRPPAPGVHVKSLPCRIERMTLLTPEIMAVLLRPAAGEPFHFVAGQYVDVILPQNRRRSFSIANPPHETQLIELHVRRVAGGEFTEQLFSSVKEQTVLRIEGPLGQFWFRKDSPRPAALIGGGAGYAPLRAILKDLLERGPPRSLHLYWGARRERDLYEDAEVRTWCARHPHLRYTPVLSEPAADWTGRRGLVHAAALADCTDLHNLDVYASGPPAMVEAVRHEFLARGLPPEQLYFDSFDFSPDALARLKSKPEPPP